MGVSKQVFLRWTSEWCEEREMADRRMIVSEGIINFHVFKKPSDVLVEEALNFSVIELRINKEGADVRLYDIRESL